jgi:hypothetical protein
MTKQVLSFIAILPMIISFYIYVSKTQDNSFRPSRSVAGVPDNQKDFKERSKALRRVNGKDFLIVENNENENFLEAIDSKTLKKYIFTGNLVVRLSDNETHKHLTKIQTQFSFLKQNKEDENLQSLKFKVDNIALNFDICEKIEKIGAYKCQLETLEDLITY